MNLLTPRLGPTLDPDLLLVGTALVRAAQKAQELALKTSTPCYVWENGQIVNIGAPLPLEKRSTLDPETR